MYRYLSVPMDVRFRATRADTMRDAECWPLRRVAVILRAGMR